jgi:hypothetical protein
MTNNAHEFSLFGGSLQHWGRRLGLVRNATNTFWLGVALGLLAWGVLVVPVLLLGQGHKVFALSAIGVHVRLLIAIPLFFLCESWVSPLMAEFVRSIVRSGVVPEAGRPALAAEIRRVGRLKDLWPMEVFFLLVAFAVPLLAAVFGLQDYPGRTGSWSALLTLSDGRVGPVISWYLFFCLPLFRFLILRWVWHLGLWWYFLWRVQRLDLHLIPTHPDRAAGLGFLEVVQEHFGILAAAISAVYAASFAENIATGEMAFEMLYRLIPLVLVLNAALFIGPLFIFSPRLWACRITGWSEYMGLASRYVEAFDRKWVRSETPSAEPLIGTPDVQSLADLNNSVSVVSGMRIIPAGNRLFLSLAASATVPLLPLLLLKYPVAELTAKLFQVLSGL